MRLALIAAVFFAFAAPARAIFVRPQMDRIDPEPLFDSEYFVDLLSFSYPVDWLRVWGSSSPVRYRVNAASLDCCNLLLAQDLVWRKPLSETLEMRFRYFQDDDKELTETHAWLELEKSLGAGFSAELFGEPSFDKGDADIGVGAAWRRGSAAVHARRYFTDFTFNKRSASGDSYIRKPLTDQVGAAWGPVSARVEFDHPLLRVNDASGRRYFYRRTRAAAAVRLWGGLLADYLYEFQKEGDRFVAPSAAAPLEYARQAHRARLAAARGPYEAGWVFVLRSARADRPDSPDLSTRYKRWESQPYARWRPELSERLTGELAAFLSYGENFARRGEGAVSAYEDVLEAKLGAGLDVRFSPTARMGFYTTWDLDSFVDHPWDGGNIRASLLF